MGDGFSHVGVSTRDMEETIRFYEEVLGFPRIGETRIRITEGGFLRHVFFEVGEGQFIAFIEPNGVPGIPADYDTGINGGLGVPSGMYHFALRVRSVDGLEAKRAALAERGVAVSPVIELDLGKSVFFRDPNGLQLELCYQARPFGDSDLDGEADASLTMLG